MQLSAKIALTWDLFRALAAFRRGGDPENLLVVRLDGFGDFALYLPYALALRELYPRGRYRLTLCANADWCEVAEKLLPFDDFIPLEVRRYMTDYPCRRSMNSRLAAGRFGGLIQPRFFREPFLEDRLTIAAGCGGAAFAVTPAHLQPRIAMSLEKRLYAPRISCPVGMHEAAKNRKFLESLGWDGVFPPRPELPPPPAPWRAGEYAVLLPGSGKGARGAFPPERWGKVLADVKCPIAVAGSETESEFVSAAAASLGDRATPLAGRLSSVEFAGLLARAALVVGNDTGGIHFAAWCGVPALAVAGGGHPGCYYPYPAEVPEYVLPPRFVTAECPQAGCRWQCRRSKSGIFPCIADVTAESVAAGLRRLLAEQSIK